MMRSSILKKVLPFLSLFCVGITFYSCKKDKLEVRSYTESVPANTAHQCGQKTLMLNVDSAFNSLVVPLEIVACSCDTLSITPYNLPIGNSFSHWDLLTGPQPLFDPFNPTLDSVSSFSFASLFITDGPLINEIPIIFNFSPCN